MENKCIELKYGKQEVSVNIPVNNILDIIYPNDLSGAQDENKEIIRALENPINSAVLSELVKNKKNVVILASDITRPSPSYKIIPPLVDEINKAGVTDNQITIIFGLGYHRKHTEKEVQRLLGEDIYKRIKYLDHDINQCVNIGTTSQGTPIEIFKPVLDSDFIIATGNLELHYMAGYSGGNKALMPGVCSKDTIQYNHNMMMKPGSQAGKIDGNPLRDDIDEVGKIANVGFILNVILNSKKEIVAAVAGDPIEAHREGIKTIDKMYKRPIPQLADIVIGSTGGYPKDINLYQAQKGLEHCSYAVKKGGRIILVAECKERLGEDTFEEWMMKAKSHKEPIKWIQEEFKLGAHKAAVICMTLDKASSYLISSFDKDETEEMFFKYADSIQTALEESLDELGADSKVLIMPYASSTLPFVE